MKHFSPITQLFWFYSMQINCFIRRHESCFLPHRADIFPELGEDQIGAKYGLSIRQFHQQTKLVVGANADAGHMLYIIQLITWLLTRETIILCQITDLKMIFIASTVVLWSL